MFCRGLGFVFNIFSATKMTNRSCIVLWLEQFIFQKVSKARFVSNELNWLIFICSVMTGCILIIVWNKSANNSNLSLLPSKVMGVNVAGLIVIDGGSSCNFTEKSANQLLGFCGGSALTGSGTCRVVSIDVSFADSCLCKSGWEWICLVRKLGISWWGRFFTI